MTALSLSPDDASPDDASTILAGTEHHGLYRSIDGGAHWLSSNVEAASVYAILVDQAGTIWLGTDEGLFRNP